MFAFLLVVQAIVAAALVTVILMQRSEGGGLTGGSPTGLMSARGAADFLTRATAVLAAMFVGLSIVLAVVSATRQTASVGNALVRTPATAQTPPVNTDAPLTSAAQQAAAAAAQDNGAGPVDNGVPLAR